MDESQLQQTLLHPATDFEDMLQYQCAIANQCDIILNTHRTTKALF